MPRTPASGRASGAGTPPDGPAEEPDDTRPLWRRWAWWLLVPGLVIALLLGAFLFVLMVRVPLPEDIAPGATTVLDRNGEEVGTLTGETTRRDVEFSALPETTRLAVLAAEDRDFYTHGGVSPLGILRALVTNVRSGEVEQGGSTITQQYVKNAAVGSDRTYYRKAREAALAIKLDRQYSKDTVLSWYLNTIYWGRGAYGIGAASQTYYDIPATEMDLNQAATLAGMISSPENADPAENPSRADARRTYVLDGMLDEGWITQSEHDDAVEAGLPDVTENTALSTTTAPYYLDAVRRELQAELGDQAVASDLRVFTGLDQADQTAAEEAVRETVANHGLDAELTAAVVSVDPATGEVRSVVGGPDFAEQSFNAAVRARRQIGSTFKAFTFQAWLEAGNSPESRIDAPATIEVPDKEGGISDYAQQDRGALSVFEALAVSANTVFAQMQQQIGAEPIVDVATRMGLPEEVPGEDGEPTSPFSMGSSMTLGVDEFTPLELAEAFNTFAAEGVHIDAHTIVRVEDADGNVVYEADSAGDAAIPANDARTVTEGMRRVITSGTGGAADIGRPAAGKTGTTQGGADGWFAGYTPNLTTVAWVGRLEGNEPVEGLSGGNVPATLWQRVMTAALADVEAVDFTPPDLSEYGVEEAEPTEAVCPEGFTQGAPAGDEAPSPDGDEPAPAETRTEVAPGTEDLEGGPCIRIIVEQTSPSDTASPSPSETGTQSPTDEPTTDEPTTDEPTTDQPTTDQPTTDEPTTDEPTTDEPTTETTTETTTEATAESPSPTPTG